jgi:golgi phosphoprotein 3
MAEKTFSTAEKFLIIAHRPEKGGFLASQTYIQYAIAGAILLDLTLAERISIVDKKLFLKPGKALSSPMLNDVSTMISQSSNPRKVSYWVGKLATRYDRYKWQILEGLEGKRILRIERRKFLGLIPYRQSVFTETYTRASLVRQLKNEILSGRGGDGELNALAGMVKACSMERVLSTDRDELKRIRQQLKVMVSESPVSDVVAQTIRQVQAAIIASVTAAAVASASAGRR